MASYFIAFVAQILLILLYFKIANHFNIIDKPNDRSSHRYITIRGGGIIFPASVLMWFLMYGFNSPWIVLALLIMALVSFLDDVITLSPKVRIVIHFLSVSILFWQLQFYAYPWFIILLAYIFTIGWINAFNFMDGINGITATYGMVALISFYWLNQSLQIFSESLLILSIISVLVFSFFNFRRYALTFAGDIGSVSMAFLLAWFMASLIVETGRLEYILLFSVYGIDTVFTIIFRLWRRENIFEAHRAHLYQYLANEFHWPHVMVSLIYGTIQACINVVTIWLISYSIMNWTIFGLILLTLILVYLILRTNVSKRIQTEWN